MKRDNANKTVFFILITHPRKLHESKANKSVNMLHFLWIWANAIFLLFISKPLKFLFISELANRHDTKPPVAGGNMGVQRYVRCAWEGEYNLPPPPVPTLHPHRSIRTFPTRNPLFELPTNTELYTELNHINQNTGKYIHTDTHRAMPVHVLRQT